MRKLTLILTTLIFSVMFSSSTSFAEWKKVDESKFAISYVDFESIRKDDEYVYWWGLTDWKNILPGLGSQKTYYQGDCKKFRYKQLNVKLHKEHMGRGRSDDANLDVSWEYPTPDREFAVTLKSVCQYAR
jgi:hypothetical protein